MSQRYFFLLGCFFITLFLKAQPGDQGPMFPNLNDGIGGVIIIDSTTNLSRIALLKEHYNLDLVIRLPKIPKEFRNFINAKSVKIFTTGSLSGLDVCFPNVEFLNIHGYSKKQLAKKKFTFNSLQTLYVMNSEKLENMDAFSNCVAIEKIKIRGTPNLTRFPKFHKKNRIKELEIDHGITFRKNDAKNYLKTLKRLSKLGNLTLANIYTITEIPAYLPKSIQSLEINSWALHDHITKIENLTHLKKYKNLKYLKLYKIDLASVEDDFSGLSLERLHLNTVYNLKDVSWIFTFDAIDYVELRNCNELQMINPDWNADVVSKIDINRADNLTCIDSLFNLNNLKSLEVRYCGKLALPSTDVMYKTPYIMMAGVRYHLYKKNGIWEKIEYYY